MSSPNREKCEKMKRVFYFCPEMVKSINSYDNRNKMAKSILRNGFKCPFCKTEIIVN